MIKGREASFFFTGLDGEREKKRRMVGRSTPKVTTFTVNVVLGDASLSPPKKIILILFFSFDKSLFLLHMRTINTFLRTKTYSELNKGYMEWKKNSHTSVYKYLTFSFLLLITNNMVRFRVSENISPQLSLILSTQTFTYLPSPLPPPSP